MRGLIVWWDGPADGPTNMALDESLAEEADRLAALVIRVYGWSSTTVSLGAFQRIDEARQVADIRALPIVRRPSGGGAIVHGSDLTYAAAVPKSHPWGTSPQAFYDALHGAMAQELVARGVAARPYRAADGNATEAVRESSFFCFDRRSAGDLVVDELQGSVGAGCKIMGSAQRRLAGVVLQHGSLLLRHNAAVHGAARHRGVADVMPSTSIPESETLARAWVRRVADALGATVQEAATPALHRHSDRVAALVTRYREDRWTCRR